VKTWKLILALGALLLPALAHADLESLKRDAIGGSLDAQLELGMLYEFGFNYPEHDVDALAWYAIAADRGNTLAAERRRVVNERLSETQRANARQLEETLRAQLSSAPETGTAPPGVPPEAPAPAETSSAPEPESSNTPDPIAAGSEGVSLPVAMP
jgi:TPR repeat protein